MPTITICIPTFNRAPMLRYLLNELNAQEKILQSEDFEIVVTNNASEDDTPQVLSSYDGAIPMRSFTHEANIGPYNNIMFCFSSAKTEFLVYCADDDKVDLAEILNVASMMRRDQSLGAVFCPWMLESGSSGNRMLSFFPTIETTLFEKGDIAHAFRTVLDNNLFPEIAVYRSNAIKIFPPHTTVSFWYFICMINLVKDGRVAIADKSHAFYTSFLDHPVGSRGQIQNGNFEVASAWDTYRGGMENFLLAAHSTSAFGTADLTRNMLKINEFVAWRQIVAMRSQCKLGNYIDAFHIAKRVQLYLPDQMPTELARALSIAAAIECCCRISLSTNSNRIVRLVGGFPKQFISLLQEHGMPWFKPNDDTSEGIPDLAWDGKDGTKAEAFAAPFEARFTF